MLSWQHCVELSGDDFASVNEQYRVVMFSLIKSLSFIRVSILLFWIDVCTTVIFLYIRSRMNAICFNYLKVGDNLRLVLFVLADNCDAQSRWKIDL